MEVRRLGDHAIVIEFENSVSRETHRSVMTYYQYFIKTGVKGITEIIPAYNSISLLYDPTLISFAELSQLLLSIQPPIYEGSGRMAIIPICYELSMDQKSFCSTTGLDWEEVVKIHLEKTYLIYMIGFLPGFLYMGDVDTRIQLPRKKEPRKNVSKGAVGIADAQTGIYPMESPGGWNIIGRSPVSLFTPSENPNFPVEIGDEVRFQRVTYKEFELILNDKNYKIERISAEK